MTQWVDWALYHGSNKLRMKFWLFDNICNFSIVVDYRNQISEYFEISKNWKISETIYYIFVKCSL